MQTTKGFLIDLGGVVYLGDKPISGSVKAIRRLRGDGIPFRFLTNTTSRPKRSVLKKLVGIGLPIQDQDIFTPADAARAYIVEHNLKPHFLIAPALREDFSSLPEGSVPAVVIGDAGHGFTYENLNIAFRKLEAGAELIALANNRKFVGDDGDICLDVGAFVAALEFASGKQATVLGKPSPEFFRLAVDSMELNANETTMIGDDAEFDASAAVRAGLAGILVHTGKWQPGATDGLHPPPTAEFENLGEAVRQMMATTNLNDNDVG